MKKFVLLLLPALSCFSSFGQTDFSATIQQAFAAYQQQAIPEKLYVHTNKSFYVAGETIWFKLYVVHGAFHTPLDLSKVAYVEVISAGQKPVLQAKIGVKEGTGNGSFMLPVSLASGNYLFRAYTAWMKNSGPDHFFQQPITIVNTFKRPDWQQAAATQKPDVQFFPEGGNLVYELESKVAFKAVDPYGKGIACQGILLNGRNDTIARFQTFKFGMGHFRFAPASGTNYKAIVQFEDGTQLTKALPAIYKQGYVMTAYDLDSARLKISVASANLPDAPVFLFVHTGQTGNAVLKKETVSGKAEFVVEKDMLGQGISQLTLFNEARQPLCERLYFKRPEQELQISVKMDAASYARRKRVSLDIATHAENAQSSSSNLSLSVFLLDSLEAAMPERIQTYLWFTSDLKGTIESPEYYFSADGKNGNEALENLLLTQGWRRFRWADVFQNPIPAFAFPPEYEGQIVSGKIVHKTTGAAAPNTRAFLSVPGRPFTFVSAISDSSGAVHFVLTNTSGSGEIIAQTADSAYSVQIENPYSAPSTDGPLPPFELSANRQNALEVRSIAVQAQHVYFKEQQQQFSHPGLGDTTSFYGVPDKTYLLDEYTRFTTLEEVLREYVAEVRVRKGAGGFQYQVWNIPYKTFFERNPLVLLDGVPVFDIARLMAFDPLKLRKIEVMARKFFRDELVADGIVSFTTYNQDAAGFELPAGTLVMDYSGLQLQREFYAPVYETPGQIQSRLPDLRNVLAWLPDVKTNGTDTTPLHFYTSDLPGTYAVVVQGIDATGLAGSAVTTFTVKK